VLSVTGRGLTVAKATPAAMTYVIAGSGCA
jgi:hypothetical protein